LTDSTHLVCHNIPDTITGNDQELPVRIYISNFNIWICWSSRRKVSKRTNHGRHLYATVL